MNPVEPVVRVLWPADKLPLKLKNPRCPICGGQLLITGVDDCEMEDNGDWIASSLNLQCEHEPDIDDPEWDEWHRWHYSQPYTDWLPLEQGILRFVQGKFYFAP